MEEINPADVAQHAINSLAKFEYESFDWHIDGPITKSEPNEILRIVHPIRKGQVLNPFMTAQTSHVVRQECESIDGATHLDQFIQSSEDIVFFQYRYVIKIVIGPSVGKPSEALEV